MIYNHKHITEWSIANHTMSSWDAVDSEYFGDPVYTVRDKARKRASDKRKCETVISTPDEGIQTGANSSFKVSINANNYSGGCGAKFVERGCYSIDIYGSANRRAQRDKVKIGDKLYMVDKEKRNYWTGVVTSQWIHYPITPEGCLNPNGFWIHVEDSRKLRDANGRVDKTDEWMCNVTWSSPKTLSKDLMNWLNEGFNAVTIKSLQ